MVSENPPGHGSNEEPTLDLEAEPEQAPSGDTPPNETPEPARFAAPKASSGNSNTRAALAGGFIGSILTLGLAAGLVAGLHYADRLPSLSPDRDWIASDNALADDIQSLRQSLRSSLETVQARIDKLPMQQPVDLSRIETKIADIEQRLSALSSAGMAQSGPANDQALEITDLKSRLSAVSENQTRELAQFQTRLEALEKKVGEPQADLSRNVARSLALIGLKAAIERGEPFKTELDTLAGVTPDDPVLSAIAPFAEVGVSSRADLVAAFPAVADAIQAASQTPDPNQTWWDRLGSSASSLVKIRPVGEVAGEGDDAIIARIEVRLQKGDLKGAASEWDRLPDAARKNSSDFKNRLDARIKAEDLVNSSLSEAMSLTGSGKVQ